MVVGAKEQENGTVAVRTRDTQQHGVLDFKYVMEELMRLHNDKVLNAETDFKVRNLEINLKIILYFGAQLIRAQYSLRSVTLYIG